MGDVGGLLRIFGSRREGGVPRKGISSWIVVAFSIVSVSYLFGCLNATRELAKALQAGDWNTLPWNSFAWSTFLTEGIFPAFFAASYLAVVAMHARTDLPKWQLYTAARILGFVATSADKSLAPPATWLLDELQKEPVPTVPSRIGSLPPITGVVADAYSPVGVTFCAIGILSAILGPLFAIASPASGATAAGIAFAGAGVAGILIGVVVLRIAQRLRHPLTVSADEIGLRWKSPGRNKTEKQIAWGDARAFFVVQYTDSETGAGRHVAFVLDSPDVTLIWDERTTNKPEVLGISDSFCALILARSGLALRDLTAIAGILASPRWEPAYASLPDSFWQPLPGDDPTLPTLPAPAMRWQLSRPAIYVGLLLLLPVATLFAVGFLLPH